MHPDVSPSTPFPDIPLGKLTAFGDFTTDSVRQFIVKEVNQVDKENLTKEDFFTRTIRGIAEELRTMVFHNCGVLHEDYVGNDQNDFNTCPIRNRTQGSLNVNVGCAHPGHVASALTHYIYVLRKLGRLDLPTAAALQSKLEESVIRLTKLDSTAFDYYRHANRADRDNPVPTKPQVATEIRAAQAVLGKEMQSIVTNLGKEFDIILAEHGMKPREASGVTAKGRHWIRHEQRLMPYESAISGITFYATRPDQIDTAADQIGFAANACRHNAGASEKTLNHNDLVPSIRNNIFLPQGVVLSTKEPSVLNQDCQ